MVISFYFVYVLKGGGVGFGMKLIKLMCLKCLVLDLEVLGCGFNPTPRLRARLDSGFLGQG